MMRQTILLFIAAVVLLSSCKKKIHCYRPYFRLPLLVRLLSADKSGLDSIFLQRLDTSSGTFLYLDKIGRDSLYFKGDTISWRQYPGNIFWEGNTYRILIPQRGLRLNITDISFEGDTGMFWDDVDHCGGNGTPQVWPKSFKVNGIKQTDPVINLDF